MTKPIPSKAAIKGHPVHPMLIPFPIVLIPAALIADVVYAVNDGEEHMTASTPRWRSHDNRCWAVGSTSRTW